jgi:hypothetical protein
MEDTIGRVGDLRHIGSSRRFRIVRQPGDGSCLFHSLVRGLEGESAETLRRRIVAFVRTHPDAPLGDGTTLRDWIQWEHGSDVEAYCRHMANPRAWGGSIELAVAARLLGRDVEVFVLRNAGERERMRRIATFPSRSSARPAAVRVLYDGRTHYDAIVVDR